MCNLALPFQLESNALFDGGTKANVEQSTIVIEDSPATSDLDTIAICGSLVKLGEVLLNVKSSEQVGDDDIVGFIERFDPRGSKGNEIIRECHKEVDDILKKHD